MDRPFVVSLKKGGAAVLGLLFLFSLTGCAQGDPLPTRVEALQQSYAAAPGIEAEAEVAVLRAEETLRFTLAVQYTEQECRVTVLAPEELAGTAASLRGESLSLLYDGLVLDAGSVCPGVSAVNCVPLLLQSVAEGCVTAYGSESFGDQDALRLELEHDLPGQTLSCTLYIGEDDAPLYGEIVENGKIIAAAEFTNVRFGDILFN